MKNSRLKQNPSGTWTFVVAACAGTLLLAAPRSVFGQAAASYGAVAGSSAAATAKTGSSMKRATDRLAGRIAGSLSKAGSKAPVRSSGKSLELVMEENRQKLEEESKDNGATLHIESSPAKATVLVDGEPVAKTPADLKLPAGKHTVQLKEFESLDWKKEIDLARGEELSLNPELKKRYQSAITISFD